MSYGRNFVYWRYYCLWIPSLIYFDLIPRNATTQKTSQNQLNNYYLREQRDAEVKRRKAPKLFTYSTSV
jgi:hypothetical protein